MTLPEGGWLEYAYDAANRLTGIENDRGETQTFSVNELGQPLTQVVRDASSNIRLQQAQAYDELSRIIEKIGSGSQTWAFAYDKVNNLTQVTDARSENWGSAWDALNRIVSETDPESATVEYAYAPNNAVTEFEDGRDLATNRVVDGFGLTIFEASPDSGDTTYWYDAADRLTQKTDGDGQTTQLTYDASDRVLSQTFGGAVGETLTFTYDATAGGNHGVGRLTGVTDASGSTSRAYDAQGRLVQNNRVIQGEGYALAYGYDDNREVTSITLPSGHIITYARDDDGLVTGVTAQESGAGPVIPIVSNVAYEPFGPLKQLTYGSGLHRGHAAGIHLDRRHAGRPGGGQRRDAGALLHPRRPDWRAAGGHRLLPEHGLGGGRRSLGAGDHADITARRSGFAAAGAVAATGDGPASELDAGLRSVAGAVCGGRSVGPRGRAEPIRLCRWRSAQCRRSDGPFQP
jgi:YD repeat-containing protein